MERTSMEKTDLVKDVLRKMGQRVAQRTEMMRVIFHADATLDVFVREVEKRTLCRLLRCNMIFPV